MWKLILGFIAFAALALFVLSRGGDIDMGGEKHGVEAPAPAAASAPTDAGTAAAAQPPASAASR